MKAFHHIVKELPKLTDFSSKILETVKIKDSPEVEGMLSELMGELNTLDTQTLTEKNLLYGESYLKQMN